MLVIGIVLIVIAIVGAVFGVLNIGSTSYNNYLSSPDAVDRVCAEHIKPIGTAPGTECGIIVKNDEGKSVSCRKGVVNTIGNECVASADHLGPGLVAGSTLLLVAGIVCCCVPVASEGVKKRDKPPSKAK